MCSHYHSFTSRDTLKAHFNIDGNLQCAKSDLLPGYMGAFIRNQRAGDDGTLPKKELLVGSFGLIPHWAEDTKIARKPITHDLKPLQKNQAIGTHGD